MARALAPTVVGASRRAMRREAAPAAGRSCGRDEAKPRGRIRGRSFVDGPDGPFHAYLTGLLGGRLCRDVGAGRSPRCVIPSEDVPVPRGVVVPLRRVLCGAAGRLVLESQRRRTRVLRREPERRHVHRRLPVRHRRACDLARRGRAQQRPVQLQRRPLLFTTRRTARRCSVTTRIRVPRSSWARSPCISPTTRTPR